MEITAIIKLVQLGLLTAEKVVEMGERARQMGEEELAEAISGAEAKAALLHAEVQGEQ